MLQLLLTGIIHRIMEELNNLCKIKYYKTKKISELEENKLYKISDATVLTTKYGKAIKISIEEDEADFFECFLPKRFNQMSAAAFNLLSSCYIQCKQNSDGNIDIQFKTEEELKNEYVEDEPIKKKILNNVNLCVNKNEHFSDSELDELINLNLIENLKLHFMCTKFCVLIYYVIYDNEFVYCSDCKKNIFNSIRTVKSHKTSCNCQSNLINFLSKFTCDNCKGLLCDISIDKNVCDCITKIYCQKDSCDELLCMPGIKDSLVYNDSFSSSSD